MCEIRKQGKVAATFTGEGGTVRNLTTEDAQIARLAKGVPGVKGKTLMDGEAMITLGVVLTPKDPEFAFYFFSALGKLGYEVRCEENQN